ncbi:hypothetical protein [Actinoplanes sp. HUAS TT8]|uniref:hypothetical protein n=1 Tax=Actinoplanes sp. HUAS TT8 TaxID=3447453 RepID=UPI003F523478
MNLHRIPQIPTPSRRVLTGAAAAVTAGALAVFGLTGPAAASGDDTNCVDVSVAKGRVTSTVRVDNNCSTDVDVRILMSAPRLGGYPCVTVGAGTRWSYKFVRAYHIYWGTEFC